MKTISLFATLLICGLNHICTAQTKYKTTGNEVYEITHNGNIISNTKNIEIDKTKYPDQWTFINDIPRSSIVKSVFSKEKIQHLASIKGSFGAILIINHKGEIVNIKFIVSSTRLEISFDDNSESMLTLKELSEFEKELKKYRVTIIDKLAKEDSCYRLVLTIRFDRYL